MKKILFLTKTICVLWMLGFLIVGCDRNDPGTPTTTTVSEVTTTSSIEETTTTVPETTTTSSAQQTTTTVSEVTTTSSIEETTTTVSEGSGVDIELTMVDVSGGTFEMGCSPGDSECGPDESPSHTVAISAFRMSAYEITQDQWEMVMGNTPSNSDCSDCPVEMVSWDDVQDFIEALNQQTGMQYRLPTEAEWEYAARAGTPTKWYCGDDESCVDAIAWYDFNSQGQTHSVGQKQPNKWGFYDMSGNVFERCQDWYDDSYFSESPDTDPPGPEAGSGRISRGGSWGLGAEYSRVTYRSWSVPGDGSKHTGFRLAHD